MKAAPPRPYIYKLSCAMYEQIRAVWNTGANKRKKMRFLIWMQCHQLWRDSRPTCLA